MKSCLVRFGVRNFKPTLRKAPERLETLQTTEGVPLPPNTLLELRRDMARLRFVINQIKQVEEARAQRLEQAPQEKTQGMGRRLAPVVGGCIETAGTLVQEGRALGAQVTNCLVAPGDHWRGSGGRHMASRVREKIGKDKLSEPDEQNIVGFDHDPRWRSPEAGHGVDTGFENGPAAPELRRRCA